MNQTKEDTHINRLKGKKLQEVNLTRNLTKNLTKILGQRRKKKKKTEE